jgi:enoyl-[acyl-carrier protein] reductase / trans-2-enoyl-CoA reductase (NAD+)
MIIKPKIRGFICITAHPEGCARHVQNQIDFVKSQGPIKNGPKKVLVIGASTGYGLSSRIVSAFGSNAQTIGVFFERPSLNGRPASAGWYNSIAFEKACRKASLYSKSINGDAFSDQIKSKTVELIKKDLGQVDLVVYSLAAPRRVIEKTGEVFRSALKPIGESFTAKDLNTEQKSITETTLPPATDEDIASTIKVMGGEDWKLWIEVLSQADVLANAVTTVAYSYIGPEITWPIYKNGTIGKAKEDLEREAKEIELLLKGREGRAFVSVNKAVVTQASSAIPVVPLYISILFKVMKEKGIHEDCIEQIDRLFRTKLYHGSTPVVDDAGRIRIDDLEMRPDVQESIKEIWAKVNTENVDELTDVDYYQEQFLKNFGFGLQGVDYETEVNPEETLESV